MNQQESSFLFTTSSARSRPAGSLLASCSSARQASLRADLSVRGHVRWSPVVANEKGPRDERRQRCASGTFLDGRPLRPFALRRCAGRARPRTLGRRASAAPAAADHPLRAFRQWEVARPPQLPDAARASVTGDGPAARSERHPALLRAHIATNGARHESAPPTSRIVAPRSAPSSASPPAGRACARVPLAAPTMASPAVRDQRGVQATSPTLASRSACLTHHGDRRWHSPEGGEGGTATSDWLRPAHDPNTHHLARRVTVRDRRSAGLVVTASPPLGRAHRPNACFVVGRRVDPAAEPRRGLPRSETWT